ncbi:iron-sulfur cluster assembly accessory protein [SAR86 cluster bacterium]|jgi:iron-sulfur cluster assembly protein|nr:iron-sulfur cluster assembly accessory protein [SAR86 cluster bacterium]
MENFSSKNISFSKTAIKHFTKSLELRGSGIGIQIGVKKAGCSGYEYFFDYIDAENESFIRYEEDGCKIFIDQKSLDFLKGSLIDYTEDGLNKGIKFKNPNVKATCGCGESFTI